VNKKYAGYMLLGPFLFGGGFSRRRREKRGRGKEKRKVSRSKSKSFRRWEDNKIFIF